MKRKISLYLMKHDRSEKMNYNKEPEREIQKGNMFKK